MKGFALIALLPFALALTKRQDTPPSCAIGCLADISLNPAPCAATDYNCLCTDPEIQARIVTCLASTCAADQVPVANTFLQNTCREAGAPVPSLPAEPQSSAPASGSASGSQSAPSGSASASGASSALSSASITGSASSAAHPSSASASGSGSSASASASASASGSSSVVASTSRAGAQPTGVAGKGLVAVGLGAVAGVLMM